MRFTKMHGAGNDFVVVDAISQSVPDNLEELARRICDRRFGVGGDGLILVHAGTLAPVRMQILNQDGSEARMCGNGVRCFAKFVHDRQMAEGPEIDVETLAGVKRTTIVSAAGRLSRVLVDMDAPRFERDVIPMAGSGVAGLSEELVSGSQKFQATCLFTGATHCVIFVDSVDGYPVTEVGPAIENLPVFPERTNVDFAEVVDKGHIRLRVWERGANETLACGTGACATVVAGVLTGRTGRAATVSLPGGDLQISWGDDDHIYMDGPAEEVFEGHYPQP